MLADDDSDTATEGEEEIKARELRKQEVRVEPPVVHTDTGTDTEVKSTYNFLDPKTSELPDILSSHDKLKASNSSENLLLNRSGEGSSPDSADFDSCIGSPERSETVITGKLQIGPPKLNPLVKSATAGSLGPQKIKRNFVIPPKEQRKAFGKEFIPSQQLPEPQPLLIIKRTPSKINLPPEVGKPKVALKVNIDAKKYFGEAPTKISIPTPKKPKSILKRSETLKDTATPSKLVKQTSLPETEVEKEKTDPSRSFNFEPEDSDLKDVDNYIEDLLANEDDLLKPVDPNKYRFTGAEDEEKVSSSIEDLLKALEIETRAEAAEVVDKPDEKIEDLLSWMNNLDHQTHERKVYRSYSDVKYKNLERILKAPKKADAVISKIPKDNITYFERHMSGKSVVEDPDTSGFKLTRSKTDVFCNKPRSSVDLDAVTNVDIKKVLLKFENQNSEDDVGGKPPVNLPKRKSFSSFKFAPKNRENSESENPILKETIPNSKSMVNVSQIRENLLNKARSASNSRHSSFSDVSQKGTRLPASSAGSSKELSRDVDELSNILKDIENFVDNTINKIGSTKDAPLDQEKSESKQQGSTSDDKIDLKYGNSNFERNIRSCKDDRTNLQSTKTDNREFEISSVSKTEGTKSENNLQLPKHKAKDASDSLRPLVGESNLNASTESVHSYTSAMDNPNYLDLEPSSDNNQQHYSVTVSVTESRIFPQFEETATPSVNIDDLYAKVNKQNKSAQKSAPPSPVPRLNKKPLAAADDAEMPQRPMRQKSNEGKSGFKSQLPVPLENKNRANGTGNNLKQPVAPQRKRSTTASPQLKRKNENSAPASPVPKKEVVKSFNAQKPQKVEIRNRDSKSKEKDCCLQ